MSTDDEATNETTANSADSQANSADAAPAALPGASSGARPSLEMQALETKVIDTLLTVYDPEIPVNIYELGMIYEVECQPPGAVYVKMTLTSPACPVAGSLPGEVEQKIRELAGVTEAKLDLVWDPPWNPSMMSDSAKLTLGMM